MSGLFGQIGEPGSTASEALLARMASRLRHQPWHLTETAQPDPVVAVGRATIGVFNARPQPVRNAGGAVSLWLAGEFYHQNALRASLVSDGALERDADDAALALAVYETRGAEGLDALEGAFLVAVWDGRRREFVMVNDRFGLYPHLYAQAGGGFTFAPEAGALLCRAAIPRTVDETTIAQFVRFQQALGDRTWFEPVRLLPPASRLRYRPDEDRLSVESYWDWNRIPMRPSIDFDAAVDEGIEVFQRAINAMEKPPLRAGVFLSGGIDGRTIVGFTPDSVPLTAITYGEAGCWDVIIGTRLGQAARRPHHWLPFEGGTWVQQFAALHVAVTSGLHGWTNAHGISVMPRIRELIDVNLSGFDGGTVFGGSLHHYHDAPYRDAANEADLVSNFFHGLCQCFNWPGLTDPEAELLLSGRRGRGMRALARESLRAELKLITELPPGRQGDFFYNHQVQRRSLLDQIVIQRTAVEVRCPFFDYAFIDFIYALPGAVRTTPAFRNAALTRRMPRLMRVPSEKDLLLPHSNPWVRVPHMVVRKLKNRVNRHIARVFEEHPWVYADYENYLRSDLREWAEDLLLSPRTQARGYFDSAAVRALWQRHLDGREPLTLGKIAPLITIELALRQLLDGDMADTR